MKNGPRLWSLLTAVFIAALIIVTSILYSLILYQNARFIRSQEEKLLLSIGEQLAIDPQVLAALTIDEPNEQLTAYTIDIAKIHHLDFVVTMDMDTLRLTHPDRSLIGKHFEGGDESTALQGQKHISISKGTLGESLRGFVPVYSQSDQSQQIGVVALGIKVQSLSTIIKHSRQGYTVALLMSVAVGFLAASCLAYYLKRQLRNLEPKEIARLLEERNAMLNETKDAVIVIDLEKRIKLSNIAANELYWQHSGEKTPLEGLFLNNLILDTTSIDLDKTIEQLYRQNGQDYLFSCAPIVVNNKRIGWIIFLRNATESLFVIDQLANTTAYASALQSQSHEFMNKLHVIYGLADLEAYDELKIYLDDILTPEKEFSHRLSFLVQNPQIAGFLIGERQKFLERKTNLLIEISPEIPNNYNAAEAKALIDLYRYIHHVLLQVTLTEELRMEIHYENDQLQTIYYIDLSEEQCVQLKNNLANNYFQQMLVDNDAVFTTETHYNLFVLVLKTHYHEVKK